MLGSVAELQTVQNASGFLRRKRLIQRYWGMSVEMIKHELDQIRNGK